MGEQKILVSGNFINFIEHDGYEYIKRNNCTGIVIIVARTAEDKLLFVEQFRPPVNKICIEFPAGLVNDKASAQGESILEGAKRELFEETGYEAREVVPLLIGPVSAGSNADLVTMVQALEVQKTGEGGGDEDESIVVHEVPFTEVHDWLQEMEAKDCLVEPKIYAGLYFLHKYNGRS